jgi:hypothetical protein
MKFLPKQYLVVSYNWYLFGVFKTYILILFPAVLIYPAPRSVPLPSYFLGCSLGCVRFLRRTLPLSSLVTSLLHFRWGSAIYSFTKTFTISWTKNVSILLDWLHSAIFRPFICHCDYLWPIPLPGHLQSLRLPLRLISDRLNSIIFRPFIRHCDF